MSKDFNKAATGTAFMVQNSTEMESTYRSTHNEKSIEISDNEKVNKYSNFKTLIDNGNTLQKHMKLEYRFDSDVRRSSQEIDRFRTTQEDYGPRERMTKTEYLKRHSADIAPAIGRSGTRQERGLPGTGLIGETYRTDADPASNSFAQRAWLYADDAALIYRRDGVPVRPWGGEENTLVLKSALLEDSRR